MKKRCDWAGTDPDYIRYHDTEWGVPVHDDNKLFEFILLEGAQAGLSWLTILKKREHYRSVFDNFNPEKIACYNDRKISRLLADPGIIRNRKKVESAIANARAFLKIKEKFGTFDAFIWEQAGGKPVRNSWQTVSEIPAETPVSRTMSRNLKQHGFTFMGPVICYAFMQATGMVNDHVVSCYRHHQIPPK
ncbi:MAG: DNA-3-methyladenine glycosylase I [Thermodesulfobacteriota bacterium]|nr:DNA-3-methyladenine glycosylase I [Thermodesulfobacteriota bacterium]